jgi:putative hydrolase of the HAD superfamily
MAAVIFDLDDALYPHVQHVRSGFAAVATYVDGHCGVPAKDVRHSLPHARARLSRTEPATVSNLRLDPGIVTDLIREYQRHRPQLWLKHGASNALHVLRESAWRTALLTAGDPVIQAAKVRALGLEALVDHVIYASEYTPGAKPAREPFLKILRRLQVAPPDAVMVGDDYVNDIEGAGALGIRTIFLAGAGRAQQPGVDAVVHLLNEVPRIAAAIVGQEMVHAA